MAKRVGLWSCWDEVAPALLVLPHKPAASSSPTLETITEEEFEISDDDNQFSSAPIQHQD